MWSMSRARADVSCAPDHGSSQSPDETVQSVGEVNATATRDSAISTSARVFWQS